MGNGLTAQTAERAAAGRRVRDFSPSRDRAEEAVECVLVSGTKRLADLMEQAAEQRGIHLYRAETLQEAASLLDRTGARVLLADSFFHGGTWRHALKMVTGREPEVEVVVVLPRFDGGTWVEAIRGGVYDVLPAPPLPSEVARIVRQAYQEALWQTEHRQDLPENPRERRQRRHHSRRPRWLEGLIRLAERGLDRLRPK